MSTEELQKIYKEMEEIFGEHLPNPEQEPIRFAYYARLYKYYHVSSASDGFRTNTENHSNAN
jgi:hypothetical protein